MYYFVNLNIYKHITKIESFICNGPTMISCIYIKVNEDEL